MKSVAVKCSDISQFTTYYVSFFCTFPTHIIDNNSIVASMQISQICIFFYLLYTSIFYRSHKTFGVKIIIDSWDMTHPIFSIA